MEEAKQEFAQKLEDAKIRPSRLGRGLRRCHLSSLSSLHQPGSDRSSLDSSHDPKGRTLTLLLSFARKGIGRRPQASSSLNHLSRCNGLRQLALNYQSSSVRGYVVLTWSMPGCGSVSVSSSLSPWGRRRLGHEQPKRSEHSEPEGPDPPRKAPSAAARQRESSTELPSLSRRNSEPKSPGPGRQTCKTHEGIPEAAPTNGAEGSSTSCRDQASSVL